MTPRLAWIVLRAAVLAVILTLPFSGSALISVEVWLAWTAALVGLSVLVDAIGIARVEAAQVAVAWTWRLRRDRPLDCRPHEVRATEGMLLSALQTPRAHAIRLQPRLSALADHFLPIRQGVDPVGEPSRSATLLGDTAWLIDERTTDRVPTVQEVNAFLDIVLAEHKTTMNLTKNGNDE